ncbi:MAG: peptidylprolyl isomerase [Caulobacteraceae bacterium]
MPHYADPDTANSQFFLMRGRFPTLDRTFTAWGRVGRRPGRRGRHRERRAAGPSRQDDARARAGRHPGRGPPAAHPSRPRQPPPSPTR